MASQNLPEEGMTVEPPAPAKKLVDQEIPTVEGNFSLRLGSVENLWDVIVDFARLKCRHTHRFKVEWIEIEYTTF